MDNINLKEDNELEVKEEEIMNNNDVLPEPAVLAANNAQTVSPKDALRCVPEFKG